MEWLFGWAHTALATSDSPDRTSHYSQAETHLSEALTRCRRIQLVEFEADIRNFLAQLALDRADRTAAREHAEIARERGLCDEPEPRPKQSPVHCYKPALDEADRLLKLCRGKARRVEQS